MSITLYLRNRMVASEGEKIQKSLEEVHKIHITEFVHLLQGFYSK